MGKSTGTSMPPTTDELLYLLERGSAETEYYADSAPLGSLTALINTETDSVTRYSYSAWGNPRDPQDWTQSYEGELFAGRGYTGHEHLQAFDLINMNGRVYDPVLARFLSPDPFVQFPGIADGWNRYGYVMNNPLKFTDPSGYKSTPRLLLWWWWLINKFHTCHQKMALKWL